MRSCVLASFLAFLAVACTPGPGAIRLEAKSGRVVDRETGAPITGADVFQVYWGRGVAGEPRPAYALRWTTSTDDGAFAFDAAGSTEARSWLLETDAAEYGFYHPDFGLVRSGAQDSAAATLRGRRLDAPLRRAALFEVCGSRPADEVLATLQTRHCRPASRPQM